MGEDIGDAKRGNRLTVAFLGPKGSYCHQVSLYNFDLPVERGGNLECARLCLMALIFSAVCAISGIFNRLCLREFLKLFFIFQFRVRS